MLDRETLGRIVREVWIQWAKVQPNPKASWLVEWDNLSEPDKEVDRRIGETIAQYALQQKEKPKRTIYTCLKCGKEQVRKAGTFYTANVPACCGQIMDSRDE